MWHAGTKSVGNYPRGDGSFAETTMSRPSVYFPPLPREWTRSFAFPIARFVLPFFVSHLTVCSSFAAFNFLRSSLRSLLAFFFLFSFSLSLSFFLFRLYSRLRHHGTTEESLKGGVNEAARLSHGRSRRRGKQVRLAPVAGASLPIYASYVGARHRKLPRYRCAHMISYR